jgi:RHS repeat-associated protein
LNYDGAGACPNSAAAYNAGRLTSVTTAAGGGSVLNTAQSTSYDALGRVCASSETVGTNRIFPNGGSTGWNYDAAGNLNRDPGNVSYAFDAEGRMTAACPNNIAPSTCTNQWATGQTVYTYDGNGNRVRMNHEDGTTTTYVYDAGGALAAEYGGPGQAAGTQYLVSDALGSTRMVMSSTGCVTSRLDYLPFGFTIPSSVGPRASVSDPCGGPGVITYSQDPAFRQRFAGKERDSETGLDYFGARYYSGAQGRFTSPDEPLIDQHPSDPQSWNLYAYARNNPLANTDPNGRWCIFGKIGNTCGDKDIPMPPQPAPPPVPQGAPGTPTYPLTQAQDTTRKDPSVQPIGPPGPTFCNIATCKIAKATGAPLDPLTDKNGNPNLANTDNKTLPNSSQYHEVTPEDAQNLANKGVTVIAVQGSAGPHGHITTVRPDNTYFSPYEVRAGGEGPVINNIGRHVEVDRAFQAFAKDRPVRYYAPNK